MLAEYQGLVQHDNASSPGFNNYRLMAELVVRMHDSKKSTRFI
jgi:hypothetical protein